MDKQKSAAYKKLVQDMLKRYPKYNFTNPKENKENLYAPYVDEDTYCKEINFYTYWQGLGYAEKTPKIKYLFVAQDYGSGSLFDNSEGTKDFIERLRKMNAGDTNVKYINDNFNESETDKNLVKLFDEKIGYDLRTRHDDLFFTNFCLGCRRESSVGMHRSWMWEDHDLFKRLYDILEPENIITMGMRTFECVYKSLTGKEYPGLNSFNDFRELLISRKQIFIKRGKNDLVPIYPIHHCGKNGLENLISDPLFVLLKGMPDIKGTSSLIEYILKLMEDRGIENPSDVFKYSNIKLSRKLFSDLRLRKINNVRKQTAIIIIFALKLSRSEIAELLKRGNYTFSKDNDFDRICLETFKTHNLNPFDFDAKLDNVGLKCIFAKRIRKLKDDM